MAAALTGDRALLEFLSASDSAADLSTRNSDGRTAAFFAAMNGHVDCLAFVLGDADYAAGGGGSDNNNSKRGKKSDRRSRRTAAVSTAAETADAADKIGCTPLWTAAAHGHLDTIKYLVDRHGASPDARDVTGTSALWMTVRRERRERKKAGGCGVLRHANPRCFVSWHTTRASYDSRAMTSTKHESMESDRPTAVYICAVLF